MTPEETDGTLRLLEAYYPGDWPLERQAVWLDAFGALDVGTAQEAIKAMAVQDRFPTVAGFHQALYPSGVIADGDRRFSPGIGWLGEHRSEQPELEPSATSGVVHIETMRRRLRGEG